MDGWGLTEEMAPWVYGVVAVTSVVCLAVLLFLRRYYLPSVDIPTRGKAVVVTGAASGIGKATCELLLKKGCHVFALDFNAKALEEAFGSVEEATCIHCDVTSVSSIESAAATVAASGKQVFALFNNAGIATPPEALMNMTDETMTRVVDTNALSLFRVTKAFYEQLRATARSGESPCVVNMTSCAGLVAAPFMGNYAMSKYAGEAFSDSLRRELKPLNIRVAIIEPFFARTNIIDAIQDANSAEKDDFYDRIQFAAATVRRLNMITAERVADNVVRAMFSTHCKTRSLVAKPFDRLVMWGACYSPARITDFIVVTLALMRTRQTVRADKPSRSRSPRRSRKRQ